MNNNNIEPEPSQDDLDIEITNLEIHNGHNRNANTATASPSPVRLSLRSQLSPRQRVLRLAITATALVLAPLIILGNIAPLRGKALGMIFGPTPAPESIMVPGTDLFYIDANPSWGKLFLDGQLLAHLPFGVLLAANGLAHRWWPQLPLADAYERSIAQQLAASIG